MAQAPNGELAERAVDSDRAFVLALGGFAMDIAGGSLVTHERIPVPRFNFVVVREVAPERQTAFFERALDHYFQRALRPTFRIPIPVATHLDATLRRLAFRPRTASYSVRWALPRSEDPAPDSVETRLADPDDLDALVSLWSPGRERDELRRSIEVLWTHPNPGERVWPLLAESDGRPVGSAVPYEHEGIIGLQGVATVEGARGGGVATALVAHALRLAEATTGKAVVLATAGPTDGRRLAALGFEILKEYVEYELPPGAELTLPSPGPAQAPRWRPPR